MGKSETEMMPSQIYKCSRQEKVGRLVAAPSADENCDECQQGLATVVYKYKQKHRYKYKYKYDNNDHRDHDGVRKKEKLALQHRRQV